MAENKDGQEKTEQPTAKRLEESRRDGEIPRSKELTTAVLLIAGALALLTFGGWMAGRGSEIFAFNFALDPLELTSSDSMFRHLKLSMQQALLVSIPFMLTLSIAAIISEISIGGWNLTSKVLMPKFSKMNPISGLKRIVSKNSLVELAKSIAKVALVGCVAYVIIYGIRPEFAGLAAMALEPAIKKGVYLIIWAFLAISLSLIVIVLIDVPWQLHQHNEKLKMTLQEVKDEYKNTEGKPEVKSRIRRMQMEMSQRRMMADVPKADVVITNPMHFAVALKYDEDGEGAPRVVAKGTDVIAAKIREIADHYSIPVLRLPPLTRAVYFSTELGEEIPEALFMAVAQVLAYIYQIKQHKAGKAKKPEVPKNIPIPKGYDPDEDLPFRQT